jgi:endonuclease VIII
MPEGDTVHRAAARIRAALEGRVPDEIATPQPRHAREDWPARLVGRGVHSVGAHGKHLFLHFDGGLTVHSHLRMTGAWGVYGGGERWRRAPGRAWLLLRCGEQQVVQFDGPLLELARERRIRSDPRIASLGPDILGDNFDARLFARRLRGDDPSRALGDALLDQRTIAGIGNLWKAECCFAVGLDPWRPLADVGDDQALALVEFARERMLVSVRDGAAARPRAVYGRAGQPCPRCQTPIRRRGQGENNRTTFWCPGCQS